MLLLTVALTAFIFYNSLKPGDESGMDSDFIVNIVNSILNFFGIQPDIDTLGLVVRKIAHFSEYFVLGLTTSLYLSTFDNKKLYPISPTYCLVIAICDEFIMQMLTEGRAPKWTDVLIDFSGALTALFAVLVWIALKNREKSK